MSDGERRLAAIMFTDMVGYTALGQRNESLSLALVEEQRKIIRPVLARHNGREIKTIGDAFLVEFPNALDAVRCAYDIQRAAREFNISLPEEKRIHLRVGLHLGDVVESQGDISGDAVNVASRIEPLAEDGGVCLTRQVYDHVSNKFELPLSSLGPKALKNVSNPVEVYKVVMPWEKASAAGIPSPANRIAVLPFASFSPDPQDEYFSDGMTEEVISTLSKVGGLEVISRTSIMQYKKTPKPVREVSRELEAGVILEGSVRKAGNRLRVTVQMIDAAKDRHLWAESYDRDFQDIFAIQSDIAGQVVKALSVRTLPGEKAELERKPTENTSAYTLYLKGRYLWNKRGGEKGQENVKKAAECFEQAVEEDPSFALGYVGQADCCLTLGGEDLPSRDAAHEKAKAMVAKALELDPDLAEAHATKGLVLMDEYKFREAEEEFRRAIELKPNYALAHQWYSYIFFHQLRWEEALRENERAAELDPLSPETVFNQAHMYYHMKDYGKALEFLRRVTALDAGYASAYLMMICIYTLMKMPADVKREAAIYSELVRGSFPLVGIWIDYVTAYAEDKNAKRGEWEKGRRLALEVEAHFRKIGFCAKQVADTFFDIGDNDKAFEWLERSYSWRELDMLELKCDHLLEGGHNDPRFLDLLKRVGLD